MRILKTFFIVFACIFCILLAGTVFGDEKNKGSVVEVENLTSYILSEVYYAPAGTDDWSGNVLGDAGLEPWASTSFTLPAGKYTLFAVYYLYGNEYNVEKTFDFKTGKAYAWPIEEDKEPFFAEAANQYYENDSYYEDEYYDPYGYYEGDYYDPYGYYEDEYYDPYGYYDGEYYDPYGYYD